MGPTLAFGAQWVTVGDEDRTCPGCGGAMVRGGTALSVDRAPFLIEDTVRGHLFHSGRCLEPWAQRHALECEGIRRGSRPEAPSGPGDTIGAAERRDAFYALQHYAMQYPSISE